MSPELHFLRIQGLKAGLDRSPVFEQLIQYAALRERLYKELLAALAAAADDRADVRSAKGSIPQPIRGDIPSPTFVANRAREFDDPELREGKPNEG